MTRYLAALFLLAATTTIVACDHERPPSPVTPSAMPVVAAPAPAPPPPTGISGGTFPAITRPGRIYRATSAPSTAFHGGPLYSRFVLYDDGSFALQYSSARYPFFEYLGTYTSAAGEITFNWEGWSTAGPWGATGILKDDTLTVKYNLVMQLSDFEDGTYVLVVE